MPTNTPWPRAVHTTLAKFLGEQEVAVLRSSKVGAMLESRGRLSLSGLGVEWQVQYRNHQSNAVSGAQDPQFAARNLWKTCSLETRAYQSTDEMVKKEYLQNRGVEAIVKVFDKAIPRLITSMKQNFGNEYYVDGNAVGNENRLHGFDSFTGYAGTIDISAASNAARTANAADVAGYPSDTYAGLSTALGDSGGSWVQAPVAGNANSHWPYGNVDPEYDFYSPILINYLSTSFSGTSHTFKLQGLEAMRFGIINNQRNMATNGSVDMVLLDRSLYNDVLLQLDGTQRALVTSENGLRSFGYKNVFEWDGVEVSHEYFVPAACGYGFNIECMELMSMQDKLFDAQGPTWDMNSQSYKMLVDFYGNLKFDSPRNFFKLAPIKA